MRYRYQAQPMTCLQSFIQLDHTGRMYVLYVYCMTCRRQTTTTSFLSLNVPVEGGPDNWQLGRGVMQGRYIEGSSPQS
jgi:hypothetical protein